MTKTKLTKDMLTLNINGRSNQVQVFYYAFKIGLAVGKLIGKFETQNQKPHRVQS